jgi:exopolyphosphatase/guanosine-5'-triphosphate,3'-diphosphate pyrophosphatase
VRLGVLDVGSNTVHLLVVDAHRGAHPTPMTSDKTQLRLTDHLDETGALTTAGADALVRAVERGGAAAAAAGCEDLIAFATSALRDATNSAAVLERVRQRTGVGLEVLPGEDEARYTFLAVRRWYGWSAGQLLVLDIGGGSLELATGIDEQPAVAVSLPLGAARLTREYFRTDPPGRKEIEVLREYLDAELAPVAKELRRVNPPDLAVGTSKTFRSLARRPPVPGPGCGARSPTSGSGSWPHSSPACRRVISPSSRVSARAGPTNSPPARSSRRPRCGPCGFRSSRSARGHCARE